MPLTLSGKALAAGKDEPRFPAKTRGLRLAAHHVRVQSKRHWASALRLRKLALSN